MTDQLRIDGRPPASQAAAAHDARQFLGGILALTAAGRRSTAVEELRDLLSRIEELAASTVTVLGTESEPACPVRLDEVASLAGTTAELTYQVRVELDLQPVEVPGERSAWMRIISNLVDNAARAVGPGAWINVAVLRRQGAAVLSVADSGPGFGAAPGGLSSLGLTVVIAEVHRLGGSVELHPHAHTGVLVRVIVPLP